MDSSVEENADYYLALFRHMQLTNMMGMVKVSTSLSRLILSLDPLGDPYHILLRLDSQLLVSSQFDLLQRMWISKYPIGKHETNHFSSSSQPYICTYTVRELPGWAYSFALSKYMQNTSACEESKVVLESAITRWPFVLDFIAKHAELDTQKGWRKILGSQYIKSCRPEQDSVLLHIAEIYATCSSSLWKRPEFSELLETCALIVMEKASDGSSTVYNISKRINEFSTLSTGDSYLRKYSSASVEDFLAEYIRFPPEIQPIDGQFMDPALLARDAAMHFRFPNLFRNNENRRALEREVNRQIQEALEEVGANVENNDITPLVNEVIRLHEAGIYEVDLVDIARRLDVHLGPGIRGGGNHFPAQRRLDPQLPLLQLLWQTFLPWNTI